jgi:DNA recombination protein RmuC
MFPAIALTITVAASISLAGVCAYLWRERARIARDLQDAQVRLQGAQDDNHQLTTQLAVAKEQQAAFEQRQAELRQQFTEAQTQARETFAALAGDVLKQANEQFLQLAKKSFEGEQKDATAQLEQRKQAIEQIVKPIRESLDQYNKTAQEVEKARQESYGALRTQVGSLVDDQRRLREETANLVKALRRPEVRGRWGEMQLRRVAELAGMIEHCDFDEQVALDGGVQRPDMVVHLPSRREIIVDAKTPIDAFISALEATDDQARQGFLDQHLRHIENQVGALSNKQYTSQFQRTPDFVVLFIPGDSFLHPAVQLKPALIEQAMAKGVIIATPSTLVALLKAVALGWREQQIAENAQKISKAGQELHRRLNTLVSHLANLGKAVGKTVEHYNKFLGSFESQVMVQARRFEELGTQSEKTLPLEGDGDYQQIETTPREVKAAAASAEIL